MRGHRNTCRSMVKRILLLLLPSWTQAQIPPCRWTAQGQGFSHVQRKSSLVYGLGAFAQMLAGTSTSSAALELNDSGPSSRLAPFDMLWAGCFSSSSKQGEEEPEDYKPFGSAAVMDPYSSRTLVLRLTKLVLFLGQEMLLVSSFPTWPVSLLQSKSAQDRMAVQQSRNLKRKPAKTHHERLMEPQIEKIGSNSKIPGSQQHFQSSGEKCLCYLQ